MSEGGNALEEQSSLNATYQNIKAILEKHAAPLTALLILPWFRFTGK